MMDISDLTNDREAAEFYLWANGAKAFVRYDMKGDVYQLTYSEVPASLRGAGVGKKLAEKTFQAIADEGRTAVAHCSYLRHVAASDGRWAEIVK